MSKDIMIYVVSHKVTDKAWGEDNGLRFIHVGIANSQPCIEGSFRDNVGDNISYLNPIYCELTAQYWIWKNDKVHSYVGLCHYRRFLSKHKYALNSKRNILTSAEIQDLLKENEIILPKPVRKREKKQPV